MSKLLQESIRNNVNKEAIITGKGIAMNKAITVIELLKRNWNSTTAGGTLNIVTELDCCKATDVWEPVTGDLDR